MSNLIKTISSYWNKLQLDLFPDLEELLDTQLSKKMKQLVALLDIACIEKYIPKTKGPGRPPKNSAAVARSFLAKAVLGISTTKSLIERLHGDKTLRIICGFESRSQIPGESSYSDAFALFASLELPKIAHEILIKEVYKNTIVGHVSKDSTAIKGREKAEKKTKPIKVKKAKRAPKGCAELTRIQKQASGKMTIPEMIADLPTFCNVGQKTSSTGHSYAWVGFKLHMSVDDHGIPLAALLSSASLNDSQAAIPLAEITNQRVTNLYDLMDSSYHAEGIEKHSKSLGHVPIIDKAAKGENQKYEKEQEKLACKNLNWLPPEKIRYKKRTTVERSYSRLKDEFGALNVRVKGAIKVFAHLMYGVLSQTADQLIKLVT
jgi:hypothetical protein